MPGWLATVFQGVGARLWAGLALSLVALAMSWHLLYGLSLAASAVVAILAVPLAAGLFLALAGPRMEPDEEREG